MTRQRNENKIFKNDIEQNQTKKNQRIHAIVAERISHLRRKLSRGASSIYRIIRTRGGWGNKQLWGFREKSRNKSSDTKK